MDITNNIYMKPLLNEEKLKKDMEFWNIPGLSVGVIKDGEIIFENGYGLRNIASHLPMTYDTLGGSHPARSPLHQLLSQHLSMKGNLVLTHL